MYELLKLVVGTGCLAFVIFALHRGIAELLADVTTNAAEYLEAESLRQIAYLDAACFDARTALIVECVRVLEMGSEEPACDGRSQ